MKYEIGRFHSRGAKTHGVIVFDEGEGIVVAVDELNEERAAERIFHFLNLISGEVSGDDGDV